MLKLFTYIYYKIINSFYGILKPIDFIFKKCTYNGHKWVKHNGFKTIDVNLRFKTNRKHLITDKIHYRECSICNKKETKSILFGRHWHEVDKIPKEIKPYLNKINLDNKQKKELQEYMENIYEM